jgi:hypothetical protein
MSSLVLIIYAEDAVNLYERCHGISNDIIFYHKFKIIITVQK